MKDFPKLAAEFVASTRRQHLKTLAGLAASAMAVPARSVPRTTTIIVPYGPGGSTDIICRMVAEHLPSRIGNQVVVDYKPGANASIGANFVRNKPPDGSFLLIVPGPFSSSPATNPRVNNYNPVTDFTPLARVVNTAVVLCGSTKFAPKTLEEVIAYARANPGQLKVGTTGIGANDHLVPFRVAQRTNTSFNFIHYKGAAQAIQDLMSGEIDVKIDSVASFKAALQTGRIRPICMINAGGHNLVPDQKAMNEQLPGIGIHSYVGFVGPAGMSRALVDKFSKAFVEIAQLEELKPRFRELGIDPAPLGPTDFAAYITSHLEETRQVVKDAKLPVD